MEPLMGKSPLEMDRNGGFVHKPGWITGGYLYSEIYEIALRVSSLKRQCPGQMLLGQWQLPTWES